MEHLFVAGADARNIIGVGSAATRSAPRDEGFSSAVR
jgi:hypothetical protein